MAVLLHPPRPAGLDQRVCLKRLLVVVSLPSDRLGEDRKLPPAPAFGLVGFPSLPAKLYQ